METIEVDDASDVLLDFASGATGVVQTNWLAAGYKTDVLSAAKHLRVVARVGVGTDSIDVLAGGRPDTVINPDALSVSTPERGCDVPTSP